MGNGLLWKRLWLLQLRMWCDDFHSSGSDVDATEPESGPSKPCLQELMQPRAVVYYT